MSIDALLAGAVAKVEEKLKQRAKAEPTRTDLGTPCAKSWSEDWIAEVNRVQAELERGICGARTGAGTPCTLESNHDSGRCRFHGGFDLTGAPKGNRNAVLHGLYSRRLQACGRHCPQWERCPCAGEDLEDLSPKECPTCPYEQAAYNAVVTDALATADRNPHATPLDTHHAHHLALLHVMTGRAAAALGSTPLTDAVPASRQRIPRLRQADHACGAEATDGAKRAAARRAHATGHLP